MTNLDKANRRSFLLLIGQKNQLNMLEKINKNWVLSLFNHYIQIKPYYDIKSIPFYLEGYEDILRKVLNRDIFGSLSDIFKYYIPYDTDTLTYPIHYIPLPLSKKQIKLIKFDKKKPIKLRDNFQDILKTFNADYIYLLDILGVYYIIDYEFKQQLMCNTIKYDFIIKFCEANNIPYLISYILTKEGDYTLNGIIIGNTSLGFTDKKFILREE